MEINIDSRIKRAINRDRKVILTTTREHYPLVSDHVSGDCVCDISGNRFIDFSSFIGVYTLGLNGNKQIRKAIKEQVDRLMHPAFTDFYAELPVAFAEKLVRMFPKGFGRVFFSNSGTEANEDAIKLSRVFTKRQYLISFYNAFHGRTLGSLGLTASKFIQREHYGPFNSVIHVPYPYTYRCPFGTNDENECADACIDYIKKYVLSKEVSPREVAAVFIEPVQGEGGYIVPPKSFIKQLRELTAEHGILLVDDEIQAGYMRTGKFLALDNFGVAADIYTMSKALGGGLPIGATISRTEYGDLKPGEHSNTFGGNLLAVAAANASLDYVRRNMRRLQRGVAKRNKLIMKRLKQMKEDYEIVGDVRGLGLMIGAEFVKNKSTKEPGTKERERVIDECFHNGLLLLPAGVSTIRIIPPITISERSLEKGMGIFEDAVRNTDKGKR